MTPSFTTHLAAQDPWAPWEQHPGKGKGKGGGPVPEPATAGLVLVALCLALYLARRWWVRRGGQLCQCGCAGRDRSDGGAS